MGVFQGDLIFNLGFLIFAIRMKRGICVSFWFHASEHLPAEHPDSPSGAGGAAHALSWGSCHGGSSCEALTGMGEGTVLSSGHVN